MSAQNNAFTDNVIKKNVRDLSSTSARNVNILNQVMSLKVPTAELPKMENELSEYSKKSLIKDWKCRDKNNFPERWGIGDSDEGVFFAYFGDIPHVVTRSMYVREDMSVEVSSWK